MIAGLQGGCFTCLAAISSLVRVVAARRFHAIAFTMKNPERSNQEMQPTLHFVATPCHMRALIVKVLGG